MEQITTKMSNLVNRPKSDQTTNGNHTHLETRTVPPQTPGVPYVISSQDGEVIYIPLSKSATRLLITGKESEDAFAIVSSGGSQSDPIGFHYHKEAHDVFLALSGSINVWAGDQCRTMTQGDFASVPPVCHASKTVGATFD
jgi:quercetin dioxygenase-like cupin family protein